MDHQTIQIKILVENTVTQNRVLGEHGLSYAIQTNDHLALFDTGAGRVLANNASIFGIDLNRIDRIGLSHGHFDHTGGLRFFVDNPNRPTLYAHPVALQPKFSKRKDGRFHAVGVESIEGLSMDRFQDRVIWTEKPTELFPGVWLTGPIPRICEDEPSSDLFFLDDRGERCDEVIDDQSLFFLTKQGVVVLLGCAHSGVINTLQFIRSKTDNLPFHHIMGGMHLLNASPLRIQRTIEAFRSFNIDYLSPCHCTGFAAILALHKAFGDRCLTCTVGSEYTFTRV